MPSPPSHSYPARLAAACDSCSLLVSAPCRTLSTRRGLGSRKKPPLGVPRCICNACDVALCPFGFVVPWGLLMSRKGIQGLQNRGFAVDHFRKFQYTPGIIQRPLVTIHKHLGTPAKMVCGGPLHRVKSPETSETCRTTRAPRNNTLRMREHLGAPHDWALPARSPPLVALVGTPHAPSCSSRGASTNVQGRSISVMPMVRLQKKSARVRSPTPPCTLDQGPRLSFVESYGVKSRQCSPPLPGDHFSRQTPQMALDRDVLFVL